MILKLNLKDLDSEDLLSLADSLCRIGLTDDAEQVIDHRAKIILKELQTADNDD